MIASKAINHLFVEQMTAKDDIWILGESLELNPETSGLQSLFPNRVHQLPAADQALIGLAIGLAISGKRVVLCACGIESIWGMLQQLNQEIGPCGSEFPMNITIKIPIAPQDDIPLELLGSLNNIQVLAPSSAQGVADCLNVAINQPKTTLLLEDRRFLMADAIGVENNTIQAAICKPGNDISVFAWGKTLEWVASEAEIYEANGISIETVDLKFLNPIDSELLASSVHKTGRAIFINTPPQATKSVIDGAFWRLESPLQHIAADRDQLEAAIEAALRY